MVVANNEINEDTTYRQFASNFNFHVDAAVGCGAHCLIKRIQGFPRSHWMLSSGKCLHRIALAAAMVDDFGYKQIKTNKTQLFAS
jgi:hypothetical protein